MDVLEQVKTQGFVTAEIQKEKSLIKSMNMAIKEITNDILNNQFNLG
ncbi:MAG: hypothetical protein HRT73_15755 [Flavobacteriales bacterium]|nr:hypothetical protein [Flavobacteriales bacterium]